MASPEPIEGRCGRAVSVSERNPAGGYCEKTPMTGQTVCSIHGGRAPQAKAAAARRMAVQHAQAAATTYGLPMDVHPFDALRGELARTQGAVLWLEEQIRALDPASLIWGTTEVKHVNSGLMPGTDRTEAAAVHGWMEHYRWERSHLEKVSATCLKAGIDLLEQQRIKQQAGDFMTVLRRAVSALGHDLDDPGVMGVLYRALSPGGDVAALGARS